MAMREEKTRVSSEDGNYLQQGSYRNSIIHRARQNSTFYNKQSTFGHHQETQSGMSHRRLYNVQNR